MSHQGYRGRRRRMALAALTALGALLGTQVPYATPIAMATAPAATPIKICAWPRGAIGQQRFGNTGFIDTNGMYLITYFGYIAGRSLRIQGQFPHARYMSFTIYAGRSTVLIDHIADKDIVPDRGSVNPFRPLANRNALRRSYTIYVQEGLPPVKRRPRNTVYTGPYHPVLVMYRVYAPDQGADDYGSVGKPRITELDGPPNSYSHATPWPFCSPLQPARSTGNIGLVDSQRWHRLGNLGGGGVNADDVYLETRLNHDDADEFVIRFKAPTFDNTYAGQRISPLANVRYWSLCMYDMLSTKVVACLHDYEAVKSRSGYVTVVISTLANRPASATPAHGLNWLPFGPEAVGLLNYRQLLPNPSFQGSFMNIASDAYQYQMQAAVGRYLPTIQTCSLTAFTPTSCSNQVNPQFCTDLTEPAPCTSGAGTGHQAALGTRQRSPAP